MRTTGFDERRLLPVDIRGTDNDGIERRIKEAVEGLVANRGVSTPTAA